MSDYIIEMLHITKDFPGIRANDDVTLQLKRGEIHALLGENGAGKSTLMSILFGLYRADRGEIKKEGQIVTIKDPNDANALGIGMVHQHFKLVHNFTVLENIVLGMEPVSNGMLRLDQARQKVVDLSLRYGLMIDPDAKIENITVGMQQRVEILKMLYRDNDILIFDEPTAVLTPQEIEELMKIMGELRQEGKSILFITHKLNEIKQVADRCTVLRKGRCIGTVDVSQTSVDELAQMMIGRKIDLRIAKTPAKPGAVALSVKGLTVGGRHTKPAINDVSFEVRKGEIVCIAGIDGNGQSELIYALSGLMPITAGTITLGGVDISRLSIKKRNDLGLSHIPEDRHKHGLILDFDLQQNLALKRFKDKGYQKRGFIQFGKVRQRADALIGLYDIRAGEGADTSMRSMSGGNQQKTIVAREIDTDPELLLAVQPTRGLDVGAMLYIHEQLLRVRDEGKGVLLVSLELDEVFQLADRILVIYEGSLVAELDPNETSAQTLGLYMSGAKKEKVG